ncbi:MAG: hypothetical protein A3J93_03420 [Candidatus Magasanikbacteria bacterium RIFOXYC2_FULL_42_28]|uniref:Radical SAM core domain-containing protein n=1 Tax=Candidatus Magasanikbacteria bacterium RIFOXYC2_FULL_42_28 TaxID=1798704 RepID=A0A1F6NUF1_9BACT|nr:MAG: hypothetical protein A3J93_03420 [Candidatus Magasanikbacteria bacterium RIFOXYC2_FULL_42_28]
MVKSTIPKYYIKQGVTIAKWHDWRWQLANNINTAEQLGAVANLPKSESKKLMALFAKLAEPGLDAVRLTPFLVSLIDWKNPTDPIRLQHIPSEAEFKPDRYALSKVWEQPKDFADGANRFIQQKYPDIILLRLASTCNAFCRFCFEKERTLRNSVRTAIGPIQFKKALETISAQKSVRQILISGGDPMIIPDQLLFHYLGEIIKIPHVSTIRLNTRALLHNPFRIDKKFVNTLAKIQADSWNIKGRERGVSIEIGVHFNHLNELSPEALNAIRSLRRAGIGVYNQTVLLKNINDNTEILTDLFRALRQENVRLHYLSHAMPVPGTAHLRTSVATGQKIMRELRQKKEFRGQLPHFETSHFTGKQIVPENFNDDFKLVKTKHGLEIHFLSDITGKIEIQPDVE